MKDYQYWETPCPGREDRIHCTCWYDGDACCGCGDPAKTDDQLEAMGSARRDDTMSEMERIAINTRGEHPIWG